MTDLLAELSAVSSHASYGHPLSGAQVDVLLRGEIEIATLRAEVGRLQRQLERTENVMDEGLLAATQAQFPAIDLASKLNEVRKRWKQEREELWAEVSRLRARCSRIAAETAGYPGLGLLYHVAIGTHDESMLWGNPPAGPGGTTR